MTTWKKAPGELAEKFLAALPDDQRVERRQMFGYPCAFVGGNMFTGLHEDRLIVRLPSEAAKRPCVIMGRTMKQYAAFDNASALGKAAMARWIARALDYAATLPPKPTKPPKKAKKAKSIIVG